MVNLFGKQYFDLVLIGIHPFSFIILSRLIKAISPETKVVIDMADPISCNAGLINVGKKRRSRFESFESEFFQYVDKIIVLNNEIKEYYDHRFQDKPEFLVIEQGVSKEMVFSESFKKEPNRIIKLIYAGAFYNHIREPFALYSAIEEFNNKIHLSVFGGFKKKFRPPESGRFYFGGKVSRIILAEKYKDCDIVVYIDNNNTLQVPGKTYEILSLNKPILFIYYNLFSPGVRLMSEYEGVFFTKNQKEDIAAKLNEIISVGNYYYKRDTTCYQWDFVLEKLGILFNESQ